MDNRDIKKLSGGGRLNSHKIYDKIISLENLFSAWDEFKKGKENKIDVRKFALNLEDNLFELHGRLKSGFYRHSHYTSFYVHDPKLRHIHKANAQDRVLHHAIVKIIEPIFDKSFIFDSYSSRKNKGTHKAIKRFQKFAWKLSQNNTKTVWILKCDIKKFFDSVDHRTLMNFIGKRITDEKAIKLIENVVCSFETKIKKGIPLGNLTSQLFSNIYLNEPDQFLKEKLKTKYYIRYADDFAVLSGDRFYLENLISKIDEFLRQKLDLRMHPKKISIKKYRQGVDFLGYVIFPHHAVLRTKTKKRILRKIKKRRSDLQNSMIDKKSFNQSMQSYLGILKHCRGHKIRQKLETA